LAHTQVRDLVDFDTRSCVVGAEPQRRRGVGAGGRQGSDVRARFADADVRDDSVAVPQKFGGPTCALPHVFCLYFNTGHGHVGWTMACGSARMLADLIDERQPDIDPTPYSPNAQNRHR
jgi:hypothetical protein